MGFGVASSLLDAGFTVYACDVRRDALDQFAGLGGVAVSTPAELAEHVQALIVLVVDAAQTDTVLFGENGAAAAMRTGGVIISSATVSPDSAGRLGTRRDAMGLRNIHAPVSRGPNTP